MTTACTRQLASARFELASDLRARTIMRTSLVSVLVVLAVIEGMNLYAGGAATLVVRSRLQQENSGLRTDVARMQTELQLERATNAALDRQVAELSHQVADLERQIAFINAQRTRVRATTQAN